MTDIQVFYDGPIVKRSEAKDQGLKRYFTGKACKYGHVDERHTAGRSCVKCQKDHHAKRYKENPEYFASYSMEWRKKNPERYKEYRENWYKENPEYNAVYGKQWREINKDKTNTKTRNRRAAIMAAEGNHTPADIEEILSRQSNRCAEPTCRKNLSEGYHVDHIMPIKLGGSNWPSNLQCLCPSCNYRKHAKHPIDWAIENGRLL